MEILSNVVNMCENVLKFKCTISELEFHVSLSNNLSVQNIKWGFSHLVCVSLFTSRNIPKLKLDSVLLDFQLN